MKKNIVFLLFGLYILSSCIGKNINTNINYNNSNSNNNNNKPNIYSDDSISKYVLPSDYENFTLKWGYDETSDEKIRGYTLNSNGKIEFWQQTRTTKEIKKDSLTTITHGRLEKILTYTNNAYLYTAALNEPGKRCRFVELKKPKVNFYSKVTWNEHNTYGSRLFRNLFDTLMTLIPINISN